MSINRAMEASTYCNFQPSADPTLDIGAHASSATRFGMTPSASRLSKCGQRDRHRTQEDAEDARAAQKQWATMRTVFGQRSVPEEHSRLRDRDVSQWHTEASANLSCRHTVLLSEAVTTVQSQQRGDSANHIDLKQGIHLPWPMGSARGHNTSTLVGLTLQRYRMMLNGMAAAFCFEIPGKHTAVHWVLEYANTLNTAAPSAAQRWPLAGGALFLIQKALFLSQYTYSDVF